MDAEGACALSTGSTGSGSCSCASSSCGDGSSCCRRQRQVEQVESGMLVNLLDGLWKIRADRNEHEPEEAKSWRSVLSALIPDLHFALGKYAGGGLFGPPQSVGQMFSENKIEIVPTPTVSEGFEGSVSNHGVEKLDNSLQQISKRMQEILANIQGRCRMPAVRFLGWILGKLWHVLFSKVEVSTEGVAKIRKGMQDAARTGSSVMLLPTHRSHIDYLLMSYVCFGFNLPVPHIAAGDNLNIPVIGPLFSYSGAFFLRRSFRGDNLYKKVLYGYLLRKLREGSPVEIFVEGGRSRTGMISDPKLGLILMAVRFVRDGSVPDILLMPASVDYERCVETSGHVDQLCGAKKQSETLFGAIKSGWKLLSGQRSHGGVYVNFEEAISIKTIIESVDHKFCKDEDLSEGMFEEEEGPPSLDHTPPRTSSPVHNSMFVPEEVYVNAVAEAVVSSQREASYITPAALLSACILSSSTNSHNASDISESFRSLFNLVRRTGAHVPNIPVDDAVKLPVVLQDAFEALRPLLLGADQADDVQAVAKERLRLRYSCGQLIPRLAAHSVVAVALDGSSPVDGVRLVEVAKKIASLVRHAIPGAKLSHVDLSHALDNLVDSGFVNNSGNLFVASDEEMLRVLRRLVGPALYASMACFDALRSSNKVTNEELVNETRRLTMLRCQDSAKGDRVIGFPEALSSVEIQNAIAGLKSMGLIVHEGLYTNSVETSNTSSMQSVSSTKSFLSESSDRSQQQTQTPTLALYRDNPVVLEDLGRSYAIVSCLGPDLARVPRKLVFAQGVTQGVVRSRLSWTGLAKRAVFLYALVRLLRVYRTFKCV